MRAIVDALHLVLSHDLPRPVTTLMSSYSTTYPFTFLASSLPSLIYMAFLVHVFAVVLERYWTDISYIDVVFMYSPVTFTASAIDESASR